MNGKEYIDIMHLYLGQESTLLRLVNELGGISLRLEELNPKKIEELRLDYLEVKENKKIISADQPFLQFIVEKINANL